MKANFARAVLCGLLPCVAAAETATPEAELRLPENDILWKAVKDYVEVQPVPEYRHASEAAREAFRDIKYGVRIHWGLYAIKEWKESWTFLSATPEERQAYQELVKTWNPTGFDAEAWMRLFKENGVKMFAFTANHLDGFSMFDTKTRIRQRVNWTAPGGPKIEDCDLAYSIMETPFKRDVVRELTDAGRKYGLKIDLYFSHPQWYDADFRPYCYHPLQTPGSRDHPELYANTFAAKESKNAIMSPDPTPEEEARMLQRHRQQLTELLTRYGKLDMVCLDMWLGKKIWPQTRETMLALRKLQPDVMFRARGIGNYGDYYTPEGFVPGSKENTAMPWFVIYPLGKGFSYRGASDHFKGGGWIVTNLVDAVSKGGNFMVGIGPDANGTFPAETVRQLQDAGAWLKVNGEAIYATRPYLRWREGQDLRFTRTKDKKFVYAITLRRPGETLRSRMVKPKAGSAIRLLGHDRDLAWRMEGDTLIIDLPPVLLGAPARPAYAFKVESEPWETFAASLPDDVPQAVGSVLKNNPLPKLDPSTDTLRVLLIGSSWGVDTISRFSEVLRAGGIRNVVGDLYHSGVTFKQHAEYAEKSSREYTYTKWVDGKQVTAAKEQTSLAGLTDEKWDVVVLMQGASESGLWQTYQPHMEQFVSWVAKNATNKKVVFALNSTWAKANWSDVWKSYPTQQDMIDRSRQSAKNAAQATGIDLILPTGTAIDNARHSSLAKTANTRDLARDDVHLDLGIGRYITACTLFEAIVKPIFGISVEGNTFRDATDTAKNTPITDLNAPIAQKCAILAVRNPWSRTPVAE